jgi:hypothetical protein
VTRGKSRFNGEWERRVEWVLFSCMNARSSMVDKIRIQALGNRKQMMRQGVASRLPRQAAR